MVGKVFHVLTRPIGWPKTKPLPNYEKIVLNHKLLIPWLNVYSST